MMVVQVVPENREEIETNIRTALGSVCDPDNVEVDLKNAVSNLDMGFQLWNILEYIGTKHGSAVIKFFKSIFLLNTLGIHLCVLLLTRVGTPTK